jgi:hypothetical protein
LLSTAPIADVPVTYTLGLLLISESVRTAAHEQNTTEQWIEIREFRYLYCRKYLNNYVHRFLCKYQRYLSSLSIYIFHSCLSVCLISTHQILTLTRVRRLALFSKNFENFFFIFFLFIFL